MVVQVIFLLGHFFFIIKNIIIKIFRFRHLDTKVTFRQSPSPEGENSRSPKRSPVLGRKLSILNNENR